MKHTRHRHVHSGVEDYWKSLWSCPLWSQALFHLAETKPSDSPVPGCVCHSELEVRKEDVRAEVTDKLWAPRLAAVSDEAYLYSGLRPCSFEGFDQNSVSK